MQVVRVQFVVVVETGHDLLYGLINLFLRQLFARVMRLVYLVALLADFEHFHDEYLLPHLLSILQGLLDGLLALLVVFVVELRLQEEHVIDNFLFHESELFFA